MQSDNLGAKQLTISLLANLFAHIISIAISFLLTPYIVNTLGKELYGFYSLANSVVSYITVVATALNSMASKYIAVELVKGNEGKAKRYFSSIFFSNIILSLVLLPILIFLVLNVYIVFNVSQRYITSVQILFSLVFIAMIIRFVGSVYGCSTYVSNRTDINAYIGLAKSGLKVFLYVALFTLFRPSIIHMGIVMCTLEIINALVLYLVSRKLIPEFAIQKKLFDFKLVISTLKVGIWNSVNQIGDLLLSSSDLLIGNILLGEVAAGNLSIIKTMPSLISGVITTINGVFMPRVANKYAKGDVNELVKEVNRAQNIMGAIVTPVIMILLIFNNEFYNLWVPGNDTNLLSSLSAIDVSRMLLIGCIWPVVNLNIVLDKVKIPSLLVILCGLLNIISMNVLIKFTGIGIYAIPITTVVITILYYGFFIPIYPCKILGISKKSFIMPVVKMLFASVCIFFVISPIHSIVEVDSWFTFIFFGGLCGFIALVISVFFFAGFEWFRVMVDKYFNTRKMED